MRFALKLAEDNRILSVCDILPGGIYDGMPIVDVLPDGNIYEYLYVNGEYVHDPLPAPPPTEPEATTDDVLNALLGVTV